MRKGDDSLRRSLEKVIVPIFGHTFADADDDRQQKLTKVCTLSEVLTLVERTTELNNNFNQID